MLCVIQMGCDRFPDLGRKMLSSLFSKPNSSLNFIKSLIMTIQFDLTKPRLWSYDGTRTENPFQCVVTIVDNDDKDNRAVLDDWWSHRT